ncbi:MAG: dephospho-CoA kinase [Rectinemataceae bacterium]
MLIGLTGGYCVGKNRVAELLEARGFASIDVDRLGHRALELARAEVARRFGEGILAADGSIDRKALGAIVFADHEALADHEAMVHPHMFALVEESVAELNARGSGRILINAAILYRMPIAAACDTILEVQSCLPRRLLRAWNRDRSGPLRTLARIGSQKALWKLRDSAEIKPLVIHNDGSLARLEDCLVARLEASLEILQRESKGKQCT